MVFNVLLGHSTGTAATITYQTEEGTADAGVDYDNSYEQGTATGQIVIPIGERDATISVHLNHGYDEPDVEDFTLHATHQDYSASATGLIYDSDEDPTEVLEHIKLVAVNFTGSHTITRDPDAQGTATAYTGAEWVDDDGDGVIEPGDGDHSYPVAYNRSIGEELSIMTGVATFELDAPWSGGAILVSAVATGNILVDWTQATLNGTTMTVSFTAETQFPTVVKHYDDFEIAWFAKVDGVGSPESVGTSSTDLYLTYDTPDVIPLYETVLHLGTVAADGESTEDGVIEAVWDNVFDGNSVQTVGGMPLYYYKDFTTQNVDTLGLLTPKTVGEETFGEGQCGAWAHFMEDVLLAQGIQQEDSLIGIRSTYVNSDLGREGILVDSWTFGATKNSVAMITTLGIDANEMALLKSRYEYLNVLNDVLLNQSLNAAKNAYVFRGADVTDAAGVAAKGPNADPASIFGGHFVCQYSIDGETIWFDPSYGCCYTGVNEYARLVAFEANVAGFYLYCSGMVVNEQILGFDADNDGVPNEAQAVAPGVLMIRPNPTGVITEVYIPES